MIIRCPECTTGFLLEDETVSEDPVKVRCSKCEHIFQVGLEDGDPALFDTSGERLPEEKQQIEPEKEGEEPPPAAESMEEEVDVPDEPFEESGKTKMGTAAAGYEEGSQDQDQPSSPGQDAAQPSGDDSEYNPFPHAGSEAQPKGSSAISGGDESAETRQPAPAAESGPAEASTSTEPTDMEGGDASAEGSVSVHPEHSGAPSEFEGEETAVKKPDEPDADGESPPSAQELAESQPEQPPGPAEAEREPEADQPSTAEGDAGAASPTAPDDGSEAGDASSPDSAPASESEEGIPQDDDSVRAAQQEESNPPPAQQPAPGNYAEDRSESSPSGGPPGPSGRPGSPAATGGAGTAAPPASSGPDSGSPAEPAGGSGTSSPQSGAQPGQESSAPPSSSDPAAGGSSTPGSGPAQPSSSVGGALGDTTSSPATAENLAIDEVDQVDTDQFGSSSGLQSAANIALIALVVANALLVVIAAQNKWFVDFQKFGQMVSVAFQGGEYTPREEWTTTEKTVVTRAPENPIEFKHVVAQTVTLEKASATGDSKPKVLVVKGKAENISDTKHLGVKVRGIVYDRNGKVITQAKTPLGGDIPVAKIRSAKSVKALSKLKQKSPTNLPSETSRPFTIIFESVPSEVLKGANVAYSVELADSYTPGESG